MDNQALANIDSETERLQKVVDDAKKRLEELAMLRTLMQQYAPVLSAARPIALTVEAVGLKLKKQGRSKKDLIIGATIDILSDGKRRFSREILEELQMRNIDVGGKDPAGLLATYLSRENETFRSDLKAGGWTLRRTPEKVRPVDAGTSTGLGSNGAHRPPAAG